MFDKIYGFPSFFMFEANWNMHILQTSAKGVDDSRLQIRTMPEP